MSTNTPLTTSAPAYFPVFFYVYAHHQVLHSFPTRRSSDLTASSGWLRRCSRRWRVERRDPIAIEFTARQLRHQQRSEEHTSELQSRGHLVCRLLLEKKNRSIRGNLQVLLVVDPGTGKSELL